MTEQGEYKVDLKDAHHLIGFGVQLPPVTKELRNIRKFVTDSRAELEEYVSRRIQAGQRVALFIPEGFEDEASVVKVLDDHCERLMVGERTLLSTSDKIGRQIVDNIMQRYSVPWITSYNAPLKGFPAFIVYSGPSLDKNIDLLEECSKHGVVFCSNTPAKACEKFGVTPDVGMCLESRPAFDGFGDIDPMLYVCDMTAPRVNWDVHSKFKARMFQPDLAYLKYAIDAGTIPLGNGGFVGSAMVNLAYLWGADPIVLLGFDLALTDDKPCTSHIGSDTVLEFSDDGMFVTYKSSHPCIGRSFLTEVPSWGNGAMVKTTYERVGYIEWMKKFASLAQDTELINATEGGARIDGWKEKTLRETIKSAMWHSKVHDHKDRLFEQSCALNGCVSGKQYFDAKKTLEGILSACDQIIDLAGNSSPEAEMMVRKLSREEPVIYTMLAPKFVQLRYERPDEKTRIKRIREIITECSRDMRVVVEEVLG